MLTLKNKLAKTDVFFIFFLNFLIFKDPVLSYTLYVSLNYLVGPNCCVTLTLRLTV